MRPFTYKISVLMAFFLFCLGTSFASAQPLRAVVLQTQGDQVVINKGTDDGVRVGQTWVLGRNEVTGAVVIEEAREHSASGTLRGEGAVGSIVALGTDEDLAALTIDDRAREEMKARGAKDSRALEQLRKRYKRALDKRTESRGFVTPVGGANANLQTAQMLNMGVEAYNIYRIYDISRDIGIPSGGLYNPWWIAAGAVNNLASNAMRNNMYEGQRVRLDVEVTHWDEELVDLQAEVMAADEGLSLQDTLAKKVTMQAMRGTDKYTVFEVHMKNVGKIPAPIGNFKYRMFMVSAEGRPISASRVDPSLDNTLQPGDEVRGMVYYPKIVAAGQDRLKVVFEQMFGDRGELEFQVYDQ